MCRPELRPHRLLHVKLGLNHGGRCLESLASCYPLNSINRMLQTAERRLILRCSTEAALNERHQRLVNLPVLSPQTPALRALFGETRNEI